IEHADALAGEFGKPDAALIVDAAATRARLLGWRRIERDLAVLRRDLADALTAEIEEPEVVLLVREDAVGTAAAVRERLEQLRLAARHFHAVDAAPRRVLQPDFSVHRPVLHADHRLLRVGLEHVSR